MIVPSIFAKKAKNYRRITFKIGRIEIFLFQNWPMHMTVVRYFSLDIPPANSFLNERNVDKC